jgi:excisionase family DNA binding protein
MNGASSQLGTQDSDYIPVREASVWLGIPKFTLYSWVQTHRIPHYKVHRRVMFSRKELAEWMAEHRVGEAV